jgi:hypothetical protein
MKKRNLEKMTTEEMIKVNGGSAMIVVMEETVKFFKGLFKSE